MNPTVLNALTDQTVATDMLISAKAAIKDCARAISETVSPQIRSMLRKQFDAAVSYHEQLTNYMMQKGWYTPHNIMQQLKVDMQSATTAMNLK
ncbi:spore gernimation protein GerQ [Gordoniibacillus kamchatkensis]|uniref:Spore gernimation protein GerQ n=2 Tax=Gordoniibacillus kamchatkensis TaxID=1590651 RepID=A0ABR5A9Z2_9BACL|nr:spore gernimation protein GerQ [Paenibacillus sp. VKM B-2647]